MPYEPGKEPWVYFDDEVGCYVYRGYALGSCLRSLVAARTGESPFPPHASFRARLDASGGLEEEVLHRVSVELGHTIIWRQKVVELTIDDTRLDNNVLIRGHLDGLEQETDCILEVKAFGDNYFDKWMSGGYDALPNFLGKKYRIQQGAYGHALQRKVRFVVAHKVETEDGWTIDEVDIGPPVDAEELFPIQELHDRVHFIESHAARDELPDCDQNCRESDPYGEAHMFAAPTVGDADLEKKLLRYDELKQVLGDEGDARKPGWGLLGEMAQLKDDIKEQYGDPYDMKKYTVGPFTASIIPNKGRAYIDRKWLKENHPDIEVQATKLGKPFTTLIVKRAKGQEE